MGEGRKVGACDRQVEPLERREIADHNRASGLGRRRIAGQYQCKTNQDRHDEAKSANIRHFADFPINSVRSERRAPARDCITNRSEEQTSELQSLLRSPYAVSCLKNTTRHTFRHEYT